MLRALLTLVTLSASIAGCTYHRHEPALADDTGFTYTDPIVLPPGAGPAPAPITKFADADRDGRVTREEAQADAALARSFDRYDENGNGELDRAEFARLEADSRAKQPAPGGASVSLPPPLFDPYGYGLVVGPEERVGPASGSSLNRTGIDEVRPAARD